MAPFMPGDFITYSGYQAANGDIICFSIIATNVQLKTTGSLTYIRMEDALIGVFSSNPNIEQAQSRVRADHPTC